MERVVEGDQLVPLGIAIGVVMAARGLDRAFDRFGARVGQEHGVGERMVDQPLRERLPLRAAV